jgi:hypothetical protein
MPTAPTLPSSSSSLLVRTDFTSDDAWEQVREETLRENADGFRAYVEPVSDPAFDRASWRAVKAAVPAHVERAAVLFVADATTMGSADHPILVVDLMTGAGVPPFRCVPSELWGVDNNLNLANMDWADFSDAVDDDGVFRGFRD